ncbi:hypothetical protein KKB44_00980 [Candidatus Micrarchaeota archaeon]|nr:hypothetical protein [Candidatus Micrarchaeota archaeon]
MPEKNYSFRKTDQNPMLILGILLILIVLFGGALIFLLDNRVIDIPEIFTNETPPEEEPEEFLVNQTNVTEICDDNCYYELAIETQTFSLCQNITDNMTQQDCYEALSNFSLDACIGLENQSKKETCIILFAKSESNLSLCDYLEEKENCQFEVDPCLAEDDVNLCRALTSSEPSECKEDSLCLLNYSITKSNSTTCDLIQNSVISTACTSILTRNDKCYTLGRQTEQDYCYQLYAIYTDNYVQCTQITYNTQYALECYSYFAGKYNDLSICDADGFELNNKWDCYTAFSLTSGNISGCEAIHELATTSRFNCAFEFAKKYGNPGACNVIQALPTRSTCYQGAILYSNENLNWTYCVDVLNFDWRNKCYSETAKLYDDISLCDYISEDFAKEACEIAYEVNKSEES